MSTYKLSFKKKRHFFFLVLLLPQPPSTMPHTKMTAKGPQAVLNLFAAQEVPVEVLTMLPQRSNPRHPMNDARRENAPPVSILHSLPHQALYPLVTILKILPPLMWILEIIIHPFSHLRLNARSFMITYVFDLLLNLPWSTSHLLKTRAWILKHYSKFKVGCLSFLSMKDLPTFGPSVLR